MTLKKVFEERVARASKALDHPENGPRQIHFTSEDLSDFDRLEALHARFPKKEGGTFYLYQLSLEGNEPAASKCRAAFRDARGTKRWNMSRDNETHPTSKSLYVGTCEDLYERFRTHLGRGNGTRTWALYLSRWSVPQTKYLVEYYQFTETVYADVELIEGVLWDSLLPLFGKKGGRGA